MRKLLDKIPVGFLAGFFVVTLIVSALGANWGSSGDSLWSYEETFTDQAASFDTKPVHLGDSDTCVFSWNVSAITGTNPTLAVKVYSGPTQDTGYDTGVAFTGWTAKGAETVYVQDKKYHPYVWGVATVGGTNPLMTCTIGITGRR